MNNIFPKKVMFKNLLSVHHTIHFIQQILQKSSPEGQNDVISAAESIEERKLK
jgi:hypothetical protein